MRTPSWVPFVYLGPAVAVMAVACLYPLLSALQLGFYDWSMGTPWSEAKWVGIDAFVAAFRDGAVWRSLVTTLIFAFVCVVAEMVLGIALALALEGDVRGLGADKTAQARKVGELVAERAKSSGIEAVVFDRGGNKYTGRVAALAEGARESGLAF